jgi:predicted phosphoribosyltransferase
MMRVFRDRHDAGIELARALHRYTMAAEVIVLAHRACSVPVAYEVAMRLALPMMMIEDDLSVANKTMIIVDDGEAAREMAFAIEELRARGATTIVAAIGVGSPQVYAMLHAAADHVACVLSPQHIYSLQAWYAELDPPSDDDVRQMRVAAAQNLLSARRSNFLS